MITICHIQFDDKIEPLDKAMTVNITRRATTPEEKTVLRLIDGRQRYERDFALEDVEEIAGLLGRTILVIEKNLGISKGTALKRAVKELEQKVLY